jgi:site-specific DNA recombinase
MQHSTSEYDNFARLRRAQAAVEGRLPCGIGATRLRDAPAEWSRQYAMLGLSN